jgi:hypothetical protein
MMPTKLQGKQNEDLEGQKARQPASGPRALANGRFPSLSSVGKQLAHEVRQVCKATWDQPFRLARCLRAWRRRRVFYQAFSDAQLALGRRMYTAGIDDGECGAQVHTLDNEQCGAEAVKPSGKTPAGRRRKLLVQLADSALAEEGPLPGADAAYKAARKAQAALREQDEELAAAKTLLMPPDKADYCRVAIGYGTMGFFLAVAAAVLWVLR